MFGNKRATLNPISTALVIILSTRCDVYCTVICREDSLPAADVSSSGIDDDLAIIKASLMTTRNPGPRVSVALSKKIGGLVPQIGKLYITYARITR